ncbi:CTP synthase [Candidatus Woesearchaeota archaeon]|nr:CTP synthase [Candidatus Woesearchaeota archaeon]
MEKKFIVVTGGVMSGVGKGVATASIGKILQEYGYKTTAIKIDPYINIDAGTLRPTEHGEVWVTADGGEIDQDLGNYERFLGQEIPRANNITTGQIYKAIIEKERRGDFLGETVQFIPHVPNEIKNRILESSKDYDITLIEIGGTIGDYENIPFLFAVKSLEREFGEGNFVHVLITYLPIPSHINEMKTKPTQTAIRLLTESGIFPDVILCRAKEPLDDVRRRKIETYANISKDYVISAPDIKKSIYSIPLNFEKEDLGIKILNKLNLKPLKVPDWSKWKFLVDNIENPKKSIKIAIVGKYLDIGNYTLKDSYMSINEALTHAAAQFSTELEIEWIDSKTFEKHPESIENLKEYKGIIVPGGFGESGVEGKIKAINFARVNKIPYLGLCYGLQLAIVEFARNVCGMKDAHTTEVSKSTNFPVIDIMPDQKKIKSKGGTMRLGAYACILKEGSKIYNLYKELGRIEEDKLKLNNLNENTLGNCKGDLILEKHRHRYEVNPKFINELEKNGMVFSGYHERKDGTRLMEFIEIGDNFLATQSHPEFTSSLLKPNPLFYGFVKACIG